MNQLRLSQVKVLVALSGIGSSLKWGKIIMAKDTQSRKWLLTINNPEKLGFTHEHIKEIVKDIKSVFYWCMADEVGANGTYHTHIYLQGRGGIRFSTLKKRFEGAHLDMAKGTALENMQYVSKTGKWEHDKKADTRIENTFEEFGEFPIERQGSRNDLADLYVMVKEGMSDYDILEEMPDALANIERLDRVRQIIRQEKFKDIYRELDITYIYGNTGTGKTRGVMEQFGYSNVYRVTDYLHPFDGYHGQDIIMFEEFRSSLSFSLMLTCLDGYPLELPCRYNNKYACYTKIYIVTNIPIHEQYPKVQEESEESWLAFLRRFSKIIHYKKDSKEYFDIEFLKDGWQLKASSPFDKR